MPSWVFILPQGWQTTVKWRFQQLIENLWLSFAFLASHYHSTYANTFCFVGSAFAFLYKKKSCFLPLTLFFLDLFSVRVQVQFSTEALKYPNIHSHLQGATHFPNMSVVICLLIINRYKQTHIPSN